MSADDLIRDRATIRATDEPDRDDRYWAAILRDRAIGEVDAVTRLADSEQAATNNRLDQAEARIDGLVAWNARLTTERGDFLLRADEAEARVDALLTERDELRASVTEYEGSLQAAQSRLARVAELADWFESQPNWRDWGIHRQIRDVLGVQR